MKWIYKATIQKVLSLFPLAHRINFLFQRYITVGKELPDAFLFDRLNHAKNHINCFYKNGSVSIGNANVLEIGTGWYPIVPVAFFLAGANDIETTDIRQLYNRESINQTFRAFIRLNRKNGINSFIPNIKKDRIIILESALREITISAKLKMLHIKSTICPCNNFIIKSNSKDIIISNNTIQLIERVNMDCFLSELSRIGRDKSILSIFIDLTDEYSHFDRSISNFNFYKFSLLQWIIISNHLSRHNRLRYSDYKEKLSGFNFKIIEEEIIRGDETELKSVIINKAFSKYKVDDLLVKYVKFIAVINI